MIVGDDGVARCAWGAGAPEYRRYHDTEWGWPVGEDNRIYEKLCLEGFQSGLAWITILRKREGFRRAFAGFDPAVVARFGAADIERLVGDAAIVRHRGKISAAVSNARAVMELQAEGVSLAGLLWSFRPESNPVPKRMSDLPSSTPESKALSRELRRRGFSFVGPTTAYAAMQSLGVVNDHLNGCHFRSVAENARKAFRVPRLG